MTNARRRPMAVVLVVGSLLLAACGGSSGTTTDPGGSTTGTPIAGSTPGGEYTFGDTIPADEATGRPDIELPTAAPTELTVVDLVDGTGDPAEVGDTVEFEFAAVVASTGTQFAGNYGADQPISFVAGSATGIAGLDEGLIGVRAGGRRQLDIPADMAFGDAGGPGIGPGEALTFVIDVLTVGTPVPATAPSQADPADCPATDGSEDQQLTFTEYPPFCIDVAKNYTATIVTNFGELTVELDPERAPLTVNSFVTLAWFHYFDDSECIRAIPGFVVQCGDPTGTGSGNPGYTVPDELPGPGDYQIGSLAMANGGANTTGSQFFIITGARGAALQPDYNLFGQVTEGLDDVVPALDAAGNPENDGRPPLQQILIESVTISES